MPIIWVVSELARKVQVPRLEGSLLNVLSWLMGQKDGAAPGEWGTQPAPLQAVRFQGGVVAVLGRCRGSRLFSLSGLAVFGL